MLDSCVLCNNEADESHHIKPVHLGGDIKGPQVNLCGGCHSRVHYTAMALLKNKEISVSREWFDRARPLINRIVQATLKAETMDLSNVQSRIILKVPKGKLRLIHRRKVDLGFSSLEKYLLYLIDKDLPV